MDIKTLQDVLAKHAKWLRMENDGERADLSDANLRGADLSRANLSDANLSDANLSDADLSRADLSRADLSRANLRGADLSDANLRGADLSRADLSRANLSRADLSRANLSDANLSVIKHDLWSILLPAQTEITGLIKALKEGRINGSTYEGECACLVGTIANVKGIAFNMLPNIRPDAERPAERWFLGIRKGDTPENNVIAKITMEWIEEFLIYTKPEVIV